jgi:P-type E1-E2 ATPase
MENKIKPETKPCLEKLQNAKIGTTMATGDNGLTAIAVGRN